MNHPNHVITQFEALANKALKLWQVPGMSIAAVCQNHLLYAKGLGVKKNGSSAKVNEQTVFQIGSLTKSFTATLVATLIDEGKLHWSDKVSKYLPHFQLRDPKATARFTILDLLTQNSGLPPHAGHLLPHLGFSRDSIIRRLRYIKPVGSFGRDYSYQNHFHLIAAAIIENITQQTFAQNLHQRIFKPLSMGSTTATLRGYQNATNVSYGHYYSGPSPQSAVKTLPLNWRHHQWVYTLCPAAGINSNALDMANWLRLQLQGGSFAGQQLISKKSLQSIHHPRIAAPPEPWEATRHYCCGWLRTNYHGQPLLWHNGGTSGMKNILCLLPKAGLGLVILSNLYHTLLPEALARSFLDLYLGYPQRDWCLELYQYQLKTGDLLQAPPGPINPSRPLQYYVGTYSNKVYGNLVIHKSPTQLKLTLGPAKVTLPLQHWGGDTFIVYWPGVLTTGAGVQFLSDARGYVDRVAVQGLNDDVDGWFSKL